MELDDFIQNQFLTRDYTPSINTIVSTSNFALSTTKTLKFDIIVKFFNKVVDVRGREKTKFIKAFIAHLFKNNRKQEYVYSILRLILPAEDRQRGNYGVKQKSLAMIIRDSLGLPKKDYQRLKHYKNPSYHEGGQGMGDFPSIASNICSKFCNKTSSINIDQVNKILDDLVQKVDSKDQVLIFTNILKQCTAEQILWIIRIILKDTKLSIKTQTVLGQYHSDAQEYFNLTNSLKQVTKKFQNKQVSLKSEVMLFHPIKPMLAGKKPLDFFDQSSKQYILQTKFDGQRLQVHMNPLDIKLFSRNAKDYTHIYKQLIPILRSNLETDACIIDGQILVLQSHSLKMVPFGMNKQVALDKQNNPHLQICYKIFDCMWVKCDDEDVNLMQHQLKKRKDILSKFVKEVPGKLQIVKGQIVKGSDVITSKFHESISRNQEGIILKDPQSPYIPTDRSINWIKLKGDYFEGLNDTMDLMIIGGYYGQTSYRTTGNDWSDRITTFLLGVVSQLDMVNPKNTQVIPFCKVGTGYSQSELSQLRNRLRKHWIRTDGKRPSYVVGNWKPKPDDRPDCFINFPQNSVILEVKAAELIKSDAFGAEKTLRFPRVVKIRYDKEWNQCLNFIDLQSFINNQTTKGLRKRQKKQGDSEDQNVGSDKQTVVMNATKKLKIGKGREKNIVEVLPWFKFTEIDQNAIISSIFIGKQFCILNMKNYEHKPELQKKILQNGGITVQNPVSSTNYIISQIIDFKYRALVNSHSKFLFIKPLYIDACIIEGRIIQLSPLYLTTIPKQSSQYFNTQFDYYGDSFTELINLRQLDFILKSMTQTGGYGEIDKDLTNKLIAFGVYQKPFVAYCVNIKIEQRIQLRNAGYLIEQSVNDNVQYVILGDNVDPNQPYLQQIRRTRPEITFKLFKDIKQFLQ